MALVIIFCDNLIVIFSIAQISDQDLERRRNSVRVDLSSQCIRTSSISQPKDCKVDEDSEVDQEEENEDSDDKSKEEFSVNNEEMVRKINNFVTLCRLHTCMSDTKHN